MLEGILIDTVVDETTKHSKGDRVDLGNKSYSVIEVVHKEHIDYCAIVDIVLLVDKTDEHRSEDDLLGKY